MLQEVDEGPHCPRLRAATTMLTCEGGIVHSASRRTSRPPGLQETQFKKLAGAAEKNCPVSKLLNAAITLVAKLI
jgi:organic hydroperoxide reductase OsmC/OhrA